MKNASSGFSANMKAKRIQLFAMVTAGLLFPISLVADSLIWGSRVFGVAFFLVLYLSVLIALFSTWACYRSGHESPLPQWRRAAFITGVIVLLVLSLLPIATWPIGLLGVTLSLRFAVLCLFCVNAAAVILVWFGRGWARVGLTIVAFWLYFLWMLPLTLRE